MTNMTSFSTELKLKNDKNAINYIATSQCTSVVARTFQCKKQIIILPLYGKNSETSILKKISTTSPIMVTLFSTNSLNNMGNINIISSNNNHKNKKFSLVPVQSYNRDLVSSLFTSQASLFTKIQSGFEIIGTQLSSNAFVQSKFNDICLAHSSTNFPSGLPIKSSFTNQVRKKTNESTPKINIATNLKLKLIDSHMSCIIENYDYLGK